MLSVVSQLRHKAEWHARRTVMLSAGVVLLAIGGGFIVAAAWIGLAPILGALGTALVLGAVFVGAGLSVIGLRSARPEPTVSSLDEGLRHMSAAGGPFRPRGNFPPVMEAFLFGVSIYLQTRNRRR